MGKTKMASDFTTQLRMVSIHLARTHDNPPVGPHTSLSENRWWKTLHHTWCYGTWDPALVRASGSEWQKQTGVGVGGRVSGSKHRRTPAADVTEPRPLLGVLNSSDSLAGSGSHGNHSNRERQRENPPGCTEWHSQPRTERHPGVTR